MQIIKLDFKSSTYSVGKEVFRLHNNNSDSSTDTDPRMIVFHWTAGNRYDLYNDYHYCISRDSKGNPLCFETLKVGLRGQHLWQRNSGAIGISLCMHPTLCLPNEAMLKTASELVTYLCDKYRIKKDGTLKLQAKKYVVLKSEGRNKYLLPNIPNKYIEVPTVTDHAFFGKADGYGNPDIGKYLKIIKSKI